MSEVKPRVRVPAGRAASSVVAPAVLRPTMRYLRPDKSGALAMRRAVTRDGRLDVFEAGDRASALAYDFMRNSGRIAGACDQMIVDTIGTELKLNARPDLSRLGYDAEERSAFCRMVETAWRQWAWNPRECDLAGKATVAELCDGAMRYFLVSGEAFGILSYLGEGDRQRYGVRTGTKISLVAPHRLPRTTREFEGLEQGIFHDGNGRATHYRFKRRDGGLDVDYDVAARDRLGLAQVVHVMDRGVNPDSPRGITCMAPVLRTVAQADQLDDGTLAAALLQTLFAATVRSPEPSAQAFEALQVLGEEGNGLDGVPELMQDFVDVWGARLEALQQGGINLADPARIAHLGPGEELDFKTVSTPGPQYLPFSESLQREMARCLGITFESFSMNHTASTYSSVRMGNATIWPIALRRRERVAAPFCQGVYEAWLDEQIATGAIPFKGGYRAFSANRQKVFQAEWQGPAKPSADDYKSAMAAKIRLETGVTTLSDECAEYGRDWEESAVQRARELAVLTKAGLPNPFERMSGGGAGPEGGAADGQREPTRTAA